MMQNWAEEHILKLLLFPVELHCMFILFVDHRIKGRQGPGHLPVYHNVEYIMLYNPQNMSKWVNELMS